LQIKDAISHIALRKKCPLWFDMNNPSTQASFRQIHSWIKIGLLPIRHPSSCSPRAAAGDYSINARTTPPFQFRAGAHPWLELHYNFAWWDATVCPVLLSFDFFVFKKSKLISSL
jgi:hypothetical protein